MIQIPNDLFFTWVESEIAQGRSVRFRSKGVSMYPLICGDRDEIVLSPFSHKELSAMDVVLFRYRGQHVLHRIIGRNGDLLTLKGDGSFNEKEVCTVNDVVGILKAVIRPSGRVVSVNTWKWKVPSYIWNKMGILKRPILRILHFLFID